MKAIRLTDTQKQTMKSVTENIHMLVSKILKKIITELTFNHPCWGERMPNAWIPLELEIAELTAAGKQIHNFSLHT
jgi:hypothetical protein